MTRRSRLVLAAAVLATAAACNADAPTTPAPSTMSPEAGALLDGTTSDTTCRGGWSTANGRAC